MEFFLRMDDSLIMVNKIKEEDFTPCHRKVLQRMEISGKVLSFPDKRWRALYLGSGEEKAVFCIADHLNRVFAAELIDERHYLNGRFIDGKYFFNIYPGKIKNKKLIEKSVIGLTFTGLVKIREFVYGYEWGAFRFDPGKRSFLDGLLTLRLRAKYHKKVSDLRKRYKDVHERNVMFEIRGMKEKGCFVLIRDHSGALRGVKVGIQAVDVR